MPSTLTYPGVYVQEIPSGVRPISGVSTSVTAFVGPAKRGPLNIPVRILGWGEFELRFGGLTSDSELSYAVRNFFLNGGSEAWVVRLAKDATSAEIELEDGQARKVLKITALEEGASGRDIEVRVDHKTDNPSSTLNLTINYQSKDNPSDSLNETYKNLSMNSADPRWVKTIINEQSKLIKVERIVTDDVFGKLEPGKSKSASIDIDVKEAIDSQHNEFQISFDNQPPITVKVPDSIDSYEVLCADIATAINANNPGTGSCAWDEGSKIITIQSGKVGEFSSVRILPGGVKDVSARLRLGIMNGGVEVDAVASIRPKEIPDRGKKVGTSLLLQPEPIPSPKPKPQPKPVLNPKIVQKFQGKQEFKISVDGRIPLIVSIDIPENSDYQTLAAKIEESVRRLRLDHPGYRNFTCRYLSDALPHFELTSGTRGKGSSVEVYSKEGFALLEGIGLTPGKETTSPDNVYLQGGFESQFKEDDDAAFNLYIGPERSERKGIYALESVDIFNLLCLPKVAHPGILAEAAAYCEERRAFLIADPPQGLNYNDMYQLTSGTSFPKTEYGAVYYPWIKVADPLQNGKLRSCAPGGAMAGLYARTDSARGVWKAPAGTEATLTGVQAVDYLLTDKENGVLNPSGVNCIRIFPVYGAIAWGSRTLRGADEIASEYKYIPVRRTALFIEESLYRGLKWVVFEPNDESLWAQIRLNVGAFMNNLFRQGAFQGKSPREAYFVKCDKETTTQNDIDLGIVNILVGFAPLKPAEFVIVKIQQMAGQVAT